MGDYKGSAQVYHEVCCQTLMEQDGICPSYITGANVSGPIGDLILMEMHGRAQTS